MSKQARHFYEFGTFRLDADDRLLQYQGEPVEISPQTLELLLALIEKAGRVVPREELVQRLWPKTSVGENSLPQAVAALRRVLSRDSGGQGHVETIPKRGYLLRPEVREVWDEVPEAPLPLRRNCIRRVFPAGDRGGSTVALALAPNRAWIAIYDGSIGHRLFPRVSKNAELPR